MKLYGLTGGIGSGKSTVALMMEKLGLRVVYADIIAREVVAIGHPGLESIINEFGKDVLDASGALDRRQVANIIFADQFQRRRFEAIIHPFIQQYSTRHFQHLEAIGTPVTVYECPLLYETGREGEMDAVIFVCASRELRVQRVCLRDGLSVKEVEQRMAGQMDEQEKHRRAQYVLENGGSLSDLWARVNAIVQTITSLGSQPSKSHPLSG